VRFDNTADQCGVTGLWRITHLLFLLQM
jgi:hypothetical protein